MPNEAPETHGGEGVCVFGGTGFLGRRIVGHLRDHGFPVRIASRHPVRTRPSQEDGRQIESFRADIEDENSVAAAVAGMRGVVNAVSLYLEHGSHTFRSVHVKAAASLAAQARRAGVDHFVHVSGVGTDTASGSPYIRSRAEGELAVKAGFPNATIVRPTVMFGPDDVFLNTMLTLLERLPVFALFGSGSTRLQPVSVKDVAEAIVRALGRDAAVYELGGPWDLRLPTTYPYDRAASRIEACRVPHALRSLAHARANRGAVADPTTHAKSGGAHDDRHRRFRVYARIRDARYIPTTVRTGSSGNPVPTRGPS